MPQQYLKISLENLNGGATIPKIKNKIEQRLDLELTPQCTISVNNILCLLYKNGKEAI